MSNTLNKTEICLRCDAKVCFDDKECQKPAYKINIEPAKFYNLCSAIGFILLFIVAVYYEIYVIFPIIGKVYWLMYFLLGLVGVAIGQGLSRTLLIIVQKVLEEQKKALPCKYEELLKIQKAQKQIQEKEEERRRSPEGVREDINNRLEQLKNKEEYVKKELELEKLEGDNSIESTKLRAFHKQMLLEVEQERKECFAILFYLQIVDWVKKINRLIFDCKNADLKNLDKKRDQLRELKSTGQQILDKWTSKENDVGVTNEGRQYIEKLNEGLKACEKIRITLSMKAASLAHKIDKLSGNEYTEFYKEVMEKCDILNQDLLLDQFFAAHREMSRKHKEAQARREEQQRSFEEEFFSPANTRIKEPILRKQEKWQK